MDREQDRDRAVQDQQRADPWYEKARNAANAADRFYSGFANGNYAPHGVIDTGAKLHRLRRLRDRRRQAPGVSARSAARGRGVQGGPRRERFRPLVGDGPGR